MNSPSQYSPGESVLTLAATLADATTRPTIVLGAPRRTLKAVVAEPEHEEKERLQAAMPPTQSAKQRAPVGQGGTQVGRT
eukprot:6207806-Pleurochrysis_carterae.AAC.2